MPRRTAFDRLLLAAVVLIVATAAWRACTGLARAVAPLPAPACYDEPWAPCPLEPEPAPAGLEDLRDLRLTVDGCTTDADCEARERDVRAALERRLPGRAL